MISKLRSIFLENWMSKLACFAIAVTLWFWVNIQQTGEESFRVPVEFVNTPSNLLVTNRSNRTVNITLQGPQSSLLGMDQSDITVRLDLSKQTAGTHTVWSRELSIEQPQGLEVTNIQPRTIRVVLAKRTKKTVPVKPVVSSGPPPGFEYELTVRPNSATIEGPTNELENINELRLKSQDLSNKTENFTVTDLKAELPEPIQLLQPNENSFTLTVNIFQKKVTKELKNVPVTVVNVPTGMKATVEPQEINIVVRGPKDSIENLTQDDVNVTVKAPKEDSGMVIRVASIDLPNGIKLVNNDENIPAFKVRLESR